MIDNDKEEGVEVELNARGRPRWECTRAGVEQLEISMDSKN